MRIVIDMQGAQTASRVRGIGRYTLALVAEMTKQRGEHDVLLVLNAAYPDSIEPIRAAFAALLPFDAIRVFEVAGPVGGHDAANDARRKAAEQMLDAFMASFEPDVIFIPSLFEEFGGEAVTSVHSLNNAIPTVVTLHDLIPLVHRNIYLQDPAMERWYFNKLNQLRRADLLLSVSDASGREALQYLNVPSTSVVTVANACDAQFHPIALSAAQREHLKNTYGINRPFVMNTGGTDKRKKIDGLLRAFASLPVELRKTHVLALVGREVADQKAHFLKIATNVGLREDDLIFTGYVTDQDLALLYNACELLVFPSWHEGFGLPVLEAMACGKAVIAANSSSLPEVIGRMDALFAPRDDAAISAKMAEVLSNPIFRQELERHGLQQAKKFSWELSAKRAWRTLERLHQEHHRPKITLPLLQRPQLAFVSPLPLGKIGIADYVADLLPELSRHYDITVIVEQADVSDACVIANAPIRNAAWFRHHAHQFDRVVYQFANSERHVYMFGLLAGIPGIVVLHDFYVSGVLALVMEEQVAYRFSWTKALLDAHGWNAVQERFREKDIEKLVWQYPCNLNVVQQALGIVVHTDDSHRLARQFYGEEAATEWSVIPYPIQPNINPDKVLARKQLGIAENDFLVCSFGPLSANQMSQRVLEAWIDAPLAQNSQCYLIFVGENQGGHYSEALLQTRIQSPAKDRIIITGRQESSAYSNWLASADIAVQLQANLRGESHNAVLDCMNYALPSIVNANGFMANLQANAVHFLQNDFTNKELIDALCQLHENATYRAALSERARVHIRTLHSPRSCADLYASAIESNYHKSSQSVNGLIDKLPKITPNLATSDLPLVSNVWSKNFPPKPNKPKLLIDVSEIVQRDAKTGIQRVTRALLQEIMLANLTHWMVEPVYATSNQPGYRYARKFMSRFYGIPDDQTEDEMVQVSHGDIFLGLDYQTDVVCSQANTLKEWHLRGTCIYFVVHDLMPVTMSDVFPEGTREGQQRWLNTISCFDGVFCVSRHVTNEFYEWLQFFGEKRERPFKLNWFHHGADLDNSAPSSGLPADAPRILANLKARPTFLMVGTIEPRKGYLQTLQAFDALWAQGGDVNLVIVGKEGWKPLPDDQRRDIPQTMNALRNHPELGKRLFWLEGISDEYLEQVYAHAACLIGASYDEGFGLPLIEAARQGVPLLVRDIPVFREVTDGHAYYFADSREPQAISGAIQQWLTQFEQGTHPRSTAMPHQTWHDSAQQVLDAIMGNIPPYKTWMPDGVGRYWGSDPRLHTEVGKCSSKSIHTTGKAGMLIYGPYERLEVGYYQLIVTGHAEHWSGAEWLDICCNKGKIQLTQINLDLKKTGMWQKVIGFKIKNQVADYEVRIFVGSLSKLTIASIIVGKATNVKDSYKDLRIWIDRNVKSAQCINDFQSNKNSTIMLQTSDPFRYEKLLATSSEINKKYCDIHGILYTKYSGIRYGIYPHHAMFNRIFEIKKLIDDGNSGWVFYLDADSIIYREDFDLEEKLIDLKQQRKFAWFHNVYLEDDPLFLFENINDGAFAIDLGSGYARLLVGMWHKIYSEYYSANNYIAATHWDGVVNDNGSINLLISSFLNHFGEEFKRGILLEQFQDCWNGNNHHEGIVFQALRSKHNDISPDDELELRRESLLNK